MICVAKLGENFQKSGEICRFVLVLESGGGGSGGDGGGGGGDEGGGHGRVNGATISADSTGFSVL